MTGEEAAEIGKLRDIDWEQLALDWASLRRRLTSVAQLTRAERAEFAALVLEIFGKDAGL